LKLYFDKIDGILINIFLRKKKNRPGEKPLVSPLEHKIDNAARLQQNAQ